MRPDSSVVPCCGCRDASVDQLTPYDYMLSLLQFLRHSPHVFRRRILNTLTFWDGHSVRIFSVDSCTALFTPNIPATISTGSGDQEADSEAISIDPKGRFAYVANPAVDSPSRSTVSMYTINALTGALTPTVPAAVATGWYPKKSPSTIDPVIRSLALIRTRSAPDGTLLLPGDPVLFRIALDHAGKFIYIVNQNGPTGVYTVAVDGTLVNVGTTGSSRGALSIAFAS